MTTATYHRRVGKTGRPLGLMDVFSKIAQTVASDLSAWAATRRAARVAQASATPQAARDAAQVRRMADHYRQSAPSFASDLYAAADQHELKSSR